ncbi:hypothetical protein HID58_006926 [Brassica napus]|uniref:non-specific serine/threonine protein kinase n=1 Tax=Brassica napus TaxID=3708 RepID=A0ABQ8ECW8_BRANA|nr:hypothetical protein HID58_006926 [Brassica napus]
MSRSAEYENDAARVQQFLNTLDQIQSKTRHLSTLREIKSSTDQTVKLLTDGHGFGPHPSAAGSSKRHRLGVGEDEERTVNGKLSVEEECPSTSAANGFDGGEKVKQGVLFDPHSEGNYDRYEDNLALMMELLGMMPRKIALGGHYSRDLFNRHGDLRHIRKKRDQKPETQI